MLHVNENTESNNIKQHSIIYKCCENNFIIDIILLLIFILIVYYILAIFILVHDYNNANECKDSYLWIYILTSVIIGLLKSCLINIYKNKDKFSVVPIILFSLNYYGLAIWGGIELWGKTCSDLNDTNLLKIGLVTFIIQVIFASICLIMTFITFCCSRFEKEVKVTPCVTDDKNNKELSNVCTYSTNV
jgi:hypothetical protein